MPLIHSQFLVCCKEVGFSVMTGSARKWEAGPKNWWEVGLKNRWDLKNGGRLTFHVSYILSSIT